jgi:glycine/D-amino acid oxidase-like deaminating enzyme
VTANPLPRRLAAPAATWSRDVDVVVLGSGAAGLSAALAARPVRSALIVTKDTLDAGSTAWAQGGLAGVLDPSDSLENHVRDTLVAGAGLCDEANVRTLVAEAPKALRYLMRLGAAFDPAHEGTGPALTREGGHSHNRIVHALGDATGKEIMRAVLHYTQQLENLESWANTFTIDLLTHEGRCRGALATAVRSREQPGLSADGEALRGAALAHLVARQAREVGLLLDDDPRVLVGEHAAPELGERARERLVELDDLVIRRLWDLQPALLFQNSEACIAAILKTILDLGVGSELQSNDSQVKGRIASL